MKIACLRFKRALARITADDGEIPADGAIARHLESCEACARELAWFRSAGHALQKSLTAEQAGAGFTDATWARLSAAGRPRRSPVGVVMAVSAGCTAMIVFALLIRHSPAPTGLPSHDLTPTVSTKRVPNIGGGSLTEKKIPKSPLSGTGIAATHPEKNSSDPPAAIRHRRGVLPRGGRRIARRLRIKTATPLVSAADKHAPEAQPIPWEQIASWYEYQGDYRAAEATYLQAVRADPSEAHLFNAGRTAECAGDVAQAIEFYTHVLKHEHAQESPARQELPSEKETSPWNEHSHSI